ncbi:hypothetical protein [Alienimonas californiensis]|uniref:Uncharacterized protein n=1 Tax=Alienimonas californiensis TaxID=2527989 RepID=A0A517PBH4_9PLAN|nr:hypothetical protein [Alienimonas californiensis]QDT16727.1 hypothetical protein CA12_28330 [Alienimonas californiensis]
MTDAKALHLVSVKTELAEKYVRKARTAGSVTKRRQFEHRARAHRRTAQALSDLLAFREREAAAA